MQRVNSYLRNIHELSVVLKVDFLETVHEIHPSLGNSSGGYSKSISNDTLARCTDFISLLKQQKQQRLEKVSLFFFFIFLLAILASHTLSNIYACVNDDLVLLQMLLNSF